MREIVIDYDTDKREKNRKEAKLPTCWICKDNGLVFYYKKINGINYETTSRCRCKKGQVLGDNIPIVNEEVASKVAQVTFASYKKNFPKRIEELTAAIS